MVKARKVFGELITGYLAKSCAFFINIKINVGVPLKNFVLPRLKKLRDLCQKLEPA